MSDAHWFEPVAAHLGRAYLRYSFTRGTKQEIDFLVGALGLKPGDRVLDVGCGPGRHSLELARRGISVHGIDISADFVELARREAGSLPSGSGECTFERLDARQLGERGTHVGTAGFDPAEFGTAGFDPAEFDTAGFDAVICLCQGAFGLMLEAEDDRSVLQGIARSVRPGGVVALSAFNAYFAVKYHLEAEFDADRGLSREVTEIRNEQGEVRRIDLWTGCFTPRELRLLLDSVGLRTESIHSVEPGGYRAVPPTVETPEFLVIARR